jgi:MAPEG family
MTETGNGVRPLREFSAFAFAALCAAAIWWSVWTFVPSATQFDGVADRVVLALKCIVVATTLTLMLGVEAVGHERLMTPAFNPLAGQDSRRLTINNRFIQNTVEQLLVYSASLTGLAIYCDSGSSARAVVAATLVWVIARWAFWIGYHFGPQRRVAGLVGVAQSMILSLWVCAQIGNEIAGPVGAIALVGIFGAAEIVIIFGLRRGLAPQDKR